MSACTSCDPPNRSLTQTAVDLKTQVQERVGEEPEGPLAEESQPLFAFTYQAPDVSFTKAMGKLKNLREEVTKNAGADMHTWDWFNSLLGLEDNG